MHTVSTRNFYLGMILDLQKKGERYSQIPLGRSPLTLASYVTGIRLPKLRTRLGLNSRWHSECTSFSTNSSLSLPGPEPGSHTALSHPGVLSLRQGLSAQHHRPGKDALQEGRWNETVSDGEKASLQEMLESSRGEGKRPQRDTQIFSNGRQQQKR